MAELPLPKSGTACFKYLEINMRHNSPPLIELLGRLSIEDLVDLSHLLPRDSHFLEDSKACMLNCVNLQSNTILEPCAFIDGPGAFVTS